MSNVLRFAAIGEAVTGVGLLLAPSFVAQLLLGQELSGAGMSVARVAGIALVALAVACWPGRPLLGMLLYSAAVTLYLVYLGLIASVTGLLLWPAAALHAVLTGMLAREIMRDAESQRRLAREQEGGLNGLG